jgi:hypothetical protein
MAAMGKRFVGFFQPVSFCLFIKQCLPRTMYSQIRFDILAKAGSPENPSGRSKQSFRDPPGDTDEEALQAFPDHSRFARSHSSRISMTQIILPK